MVTNPQILFTHPDNVFIKHLYLYTTFLPLENMGPKDQSLGLCPLVDTSDPPSLNRNVIKSSW